MGGYYKSPPISQKFARRPHPWRSLRGSNPPPTMKISFPSLKGGFTAPELLVLVGGLAMATTILPALGKAKAKANRVKCAYNVGHITKSFHACATEMDGAFPWHYPGFELANKERRNPFIKSMGANDVSDIYNVETIWRLYPLRQSLHAYASLTSPCDPRAIDNGRKHKIKSFAEHGDRTDFIVPRQMQSYAIHMGGDSYLPESILATTRNFDGDDPVPTRHVSKEKIIPKFGRSLRSKNLKNAHYLGADEANHSRVMGGLNASQGNLARSDGSRMQGDDTLLHDAMRRHARGAGQGSALELNENLSRPRQ